MRNEILDILDKMKLPLSTIEKDLEFANGLLGKIRKDESRKLSEENFQKLCSFFKEKTGKEYIKNGGGGNLANAINYLPADEHSFDASKLSKEIKDELVFAAPGKKDSEIQELKIEIERLKKENEELRPDAIAWRSRMQNMGVDLAGEKTTLTVTEAVNCYKEERKRVKDAKVEMYEPEEGTSAHFIRYGAFYKSELKK